VGAVLLAVVYLATSLALAAAVRWWSSGRRSLRPSIGAFLLLTLLPLAFTAGGFWRQKVLAPTVALAGVAPWASPPLVAQLEAGSSPRNPLLLDPLAQFEPWRQAARDGLLFNAAQGSGAALLANGQSAVLFPLEVVGRLLSPVRAATYVQAARLLLAAWGMFLLVRRLALGETAAVLAAAVFLGGGFLQLWRAHPHSSVAALAPWIVVAAIDLVRRPGARSAVLLAALGALAVFAGHPETLLHVVLLAALVAAPALIARRDRWRSLLGWGALAALLAFLLAAPALLPFAENLHASAEWQMRQDREPQLVEVPFGEALLRLAPAMSFHLLGDPFAGNWSGPENLAELGGGSVGAAAWVLLPLAFAVPRRRRMAAGWLAIGVVGLLVGAHTPWISKPFGWVPLLSTSLLKRLSLWWVLAAAVLAAMAVEALLARRRATPGAVTGARRRAWLALWGTAGFAALLLALALALTGGRLPAGAWSLPAFGGELGLALAAGLAAAGLALLARQPAPPRRGRSPLPVGAALCLALLAALLIVPRAAVFARWVPLSSALSFYPEMAAVRFVQERIAEERTAAGGGQGWRVAGLDAALVPHSAAFFGLEEVRAYDPKTLAPYQRFAGRLGDKPHAGWQRVLEPRNAALSYLGARFIFDHPDHGTRPGVERVYAGADAAVYENPAALPRLFAPRHWRVFATAEAALAAALVIDDFAVEAAVVADQLPAAVRVGGEGLNGEVVVRSLAVERAGRVRAELVAAAPALVVTSQPAIPGWRLTIDGRRVPPLSVNGAFLGAWVEAGAHQVDFRYAPASWRWGCALAGLGLLAAVGLIATGGRR
jgi:hypothetical protein